MLTYCILNNRCQTASNHRKVENGAVASVANVTSCAAELAVPRGRVSHRLLTPAFFLVVFRGRTLS